ncbi:MAG: hypothetical protein Q9185_000767 [Variospora sp. 1 TL-2023]
MSARGSPLRKAWDDARRARPQIALAAFKQYRDEDRFTDLTIVCHDHEFKCHKVIVCAQSSFFAAVCTNGFQECLTSKVELPDDDPYHIFLLLEFLYGQAYFMWNDTRNGLDFDDPRYLPRIHIHLYELGDKYHIPELCRVAASCLGSTLHWTNPQQLLSCVQLIYQRECNVAQVLRGEIISQIISRSADIVEDEEQKERLVKLVHENEHFREELFRAQLHDLAKTQDPTGGWNARGMRRDDSPCSNFSAEIGLNWFGI